LSRVEIPVEAKLNAGDIDAELKQLTQKINALGASIAKANQVKFNPIGKATLDDLKRVQAEFEKLKRTSQLGADINRTGQGGKSFFDLDWNSLASNSIAREARRYGAFNRIMAGTGASFTQNAAPGGGGNGGGGGRGRGSFSPGAGGSPWGNAGRKIVSAGLSGAGSVGAAADDAISAGMAGGAMVGVIGLVGGIVAAGVKSVMAKVGDAQTDAIGYDTLKRTLGDVNVSFSVLQKSMHAASDAFDGTYQQALKMGGEFARISGMSGKQGAEALANEVANAGGFGRAFGIDPEQSNQFFAQMRQFGVTSNDRDSKRLGIEIAEGITKSGSFSKTDEVLQAIGAYTSQQTRMGLSPANAGGYNAMLTGIMQANIPGVDVAGAAGVLGRVNSAIASGGNAGEAGQNFMYMALGRRLNLDPIMAAALREQGAFGTGQQEFKPDSVMGRWAAINHVNISGAASSSTKTSLQMLQEQLRSTYGNTGQGAELRLDAMSNLFGLNHNQAALLDQITPAQMGQVQDRLKKIGIDPKDLNPTAYAMVAQAAVGSSNDLKDVGSQIWSKLSPAERDSLTKAQASGDDSYRTELMKDAAKYGQPDTEGSKTRETIQGVDKTLQDYASKAVPALNVMRDAMVYMAGDHGKTSPDAMRKTVYDARKGDIDKKYDDQINAARSAYTKLTVGLRGTPDAQLEKQIRAASDNLKSTEDSANIQRAIDTAALGREMYSDNFKSSPGSSAALPAFLQKGDDASSAGAGGTGYGGSAGPSDAVKAQFRAQYGAEAAYIANKLGVDPDLILAQAAKESNWGRSVHGNNLFNIQKRKSWTGATQMLTDHDANGNPYQAQFEVHKDWQQDADAYVDVINRMDPGVRGSGRNIGQFTGGLVHAQGWAQDPSYAAGIRDTYAALQGTPLPDTGSSSSTAGAGGNSSHSFDFNINLFHSNGQAAAAPFNINTSVNVPAPHGTGS
jgi:flagellum-specific peptidoglycan hydrolase FlgJ